MKKVWIINHYADPPGVGKFTRHYHFAKYLIQNGYDVKIFTASTIHTTDINFITNQDLYKEQIFDGVPYVFVKACSYHGNSHQRILNMIQYYYRVGMVAKRFGECDIIYTSAPHSLTWLAAKKLAKKMKIPWIAETRDLWPETFVALGKMKRTDIPAKILYRIEKEVYEKADRLIFTFPGGKDYVRSIGVDENKVEYINNGIDMEEFQAQMQQHAFEDPDLDDPTTFKVVFAGALGKANDLTRVLKSFELLQERGHYNIKFLLYGGGGEEDQLREYARKHALQNVIFKGRIPKKQIPYLLSKSNLQLLSLAHAPELFRYGLSPNKLFEYLASGKPTISNVECGYDILKEYECGETVQGDSVEALADGILKFSQMPQEEYDRYCHKAKQAAKDFDFNILGARLEKILSELI